MRSGIRPSSEALLYVAITIFAMASAYTSMHGIRVIWSGSDIIDTVVIPWAIAIGLSLMMVFLAANLNKYARQKKIIQIVVVYCFIASISFFFNLHSFESRQAIEGDISADLKNLRDAFNGAYAQGLIGIEQELEIPALKVSTAQYDADRKSERINPVNPGEGIVYFSHDRKFRRDSTLLAERTAQLNGIKSELSIILDNSVASIDNALDNNNIDFQLDVLSSEASQFERFNSTIRQTAPSYQSPTLNYESELSTDPSRTVTSFFEVLTGGSGHEKSRLFISAILSFLLDFPLFFALVILSTKATQNNEEYYMSGNPLSSERHVSAAVNEGNADNEANRKKNKSSKDIHDLW